MAVDAEAKKKAEALKKNQLRNQQAREKRAKAAKKKKDSELASKGPAEMLFTGVGTTPPMTMTPLSATSLSVPTSTPASSVGSVSTVKTKTTEKVVVDKGKKKKIPPSRSSSSSSMTKRPQSVREPSDSLMEMIDHATLIDVNNLPRIFTSNAYKMNVDLDEEQRILLYGDKEGQAKVRDITVAATAALDAAIDVDARNNLFREAGVPPLPTTIPAMYDGWGTKNVLSVRSAWAKVRLPESEIRCAELKNEESDRVGRERPMVAQMTPPITEESEGSALSSPPASSPSITADTMSIENDTTNHSWFNESRAEQDPALAVLSEATEQFLKSTIEGAIGKARLRLNLDGVRLWHTLQTHAAAHNNNGNDVDQSPPPALIRLGCDVRSQVALSQGNAAKVYQRMEEAISRRNEDHPPKYDPNDIEQMILDSTSMGDLSKKPLLKHAAEMADVDAKRKFAVFSGADSADPPFGRVPKKVVVTGQDLDVGTLGNRMMTISSRRNR